MTQLSLHWLRVGHCRHLECIAQRGGRLTSTEFPSLCGLVLHPDIGWILFDTGYAPHFFHATQPFPERLYRALLPVSLPHEETLLAQLRSRDIAPADIKVVVISHYHGDHVAGLRDFPAARFIASREDSEQLRQALHQRWRMTCAGKLPALLPADFWTRVKYTEDCAAHSLPAWMAPFTQGRDLLGDGSLIALALPGHSSGQIGLFMPDASGRPVLLAADACWSLPACREGRLPSRLTRFITDDARTYAETFHRLQQLTNREPAVVILPSHCASSWRSFQNG